MLNETDDPADDERDTDSFVSYAQNYEDVVLWRAFKTIAHGSYVDVGAADPFDDSVTAAFYERGWSGLNVEPVPAFAAALRAARPRDLVVEQGVASAPGMAVFHVVEGTGWSTFDPSMPTVAADHGYGSTEIEVALSTLDAVLGDAGYDGRPIHFLKIDVEGFEGEVLRGTNLAHWKPWVVVVEATAPGTTTQTHAEWEHLVVDAGYQFCLFDGLNRYYVHHEHADFVPMLSYPVSIFDQPFKRQSDAAVETRLIHSLGEQDRLVGEVRRHVTEIDRLAREVSRVASEADRLRARVEHEVELVDVLRHEVAGIRAEARGLAGDNVRWRNDALIERVRADDHAIGRVHAEHHFHAATHQSNNLQAELDAIHGTLSWRVTRPLRMIRGIRHRAKPPVLATPPLADTTTIEPKEPVAVTADVGATMARAFLTRMRQVAELLLRSAEDDLPETPADALKRGLRESTESDLTKAWLGIVAATGHYPDEDNLRAEVRHLRRAGADQFVTHLTALFELSVREGRGTDVVLDVVSKSVLVDVTHTAQHDLLTGIQRVVRETCSRWLRKPSAQAVWWDDMGNVLRRLDNDEVERFRDWREHMPTSRGTTTSRRSLDHMPSAVIVPWKSILLVPELAADISRSNGYRALSCSHVLQGISMVGYDLIPVTAAETVTQGMSQVFNVFLAMVKRTSRLSAISESAADDFRAFNCALPSQGLTGPVVAAHLLPPSPPHLRDADVAAVRDALSLGALPLVVVVGSHEPRKNHLTVLEAAERLWSAGVWFDLVFIGGSSWGADRFDSEIERLQSMSRPVRVLKRATEAELWAAYRLARFSVFPSLIEGYGLPIVESMASGTPVITTNYGSMAEVAAGGGALLVDPYDAVALEDAMKSLLEDHALLARLQQEVSDRTFPDWDSYSADVWKFLVDDAWGADQD